MFKKGCNGILIIAVLVFIGLLYISDMETDFSLKASSTKKTLRIPLAISNKIGKELDFSHYLFKSELEMVQAGYMPGEIAGILTDNIKSLMPIKENEILYRGLRLSISALERVMLKGMTVSETFTDKISVTFYPDKAVDYAFWPDTRSEPPERDFLCVVFKLDSSKIPHSVEITRGSFLDVDITEERMVTEQDILAKYILGIYFFNKTKGQFEDVTESIKKIFKGTTITGKRVKSNL